MIKICPQCQVQFNTYRSEQIYCSNNCRRIYNTNHKKPSREELRKFFFDSIEHNRVCKVCGNTFKITQQHRSKKYCSTECRKKAERLYGSKSETDLEYKDKIRFGGNKYTVLKRDNYECQMCGNKHQLVIHHKDNSGQSDSPNNDIDNLITLCRRCHINIHRILE